MVYDVGLMTLNEIDRICAENECRNCPLSIKEEEYILVGYPDNHARSFSFSCAPTLRTFKRMYGERLVKVNTGFKKIVFEGAEKHERF